ncbi:MAG: sulfurtransferase [Nitrospirae bacterium]|nr:sulfurtransferase [Nitrospirota bacterium]
MLQDFMRERMVRRKFLTVLCALFLFSLLFFSHQTVIAGTEAQALVETSWLADNLKNPGLAIVYVGGPTSKKENFELKHVPGAVFLDFSVLMGAIGDGSTPPDKAKFEALVGGLGIGNDNHVIIHSSDTLFAAGAFWLFDYFGHKKLSMLNGTITKWMNEGRVTAGGPAKITPAMYKATPNASLIATADDVLKNLKNPKAVIVDTRGTDEYKGVYADESKMGNKKVGHIPGAADIGFFSANLNSDGTFKSAKDIKSAYEAKGVTKDKEVITYCQAGIRAAHTYFALKHILGYPNVRNYVGSWGEWGNRLDTAKYPIEK